MNLIQHKFVHDYYHFYLFNDYMQAGICPSNSTNKNNSFKRSDSVQLVECVDSSVFVDIKIVC